MIQPEKIKKISHRAKLLRLITWWGWGTIAGFIIVSSLLLFVFHVYGETFASVTGRISDILTIIIFILSLTNLFYGIILKITSKKLNREIPGSYLSTMIGIVGTILCLAFIPGTITHFL